MIIYQNKSGTWHTIKTFNQNITVDEIIDKMLKLKNHITKDHLTCMVCYEDIPENMFYHPYYKCTCNNMLVTCNKCLQEAFNCPYCRKLTNTPIEPSEYVFTEQGKVEESIDVTDAFRLAKIAQMSHVDMDKWKGIPAVVKMLKEMKKVNLFEIPDPFRTQETKTEDNPQITRLEKQIKKLKKQLKGKKKNERTVE
jgi:hypothetical protein